MVQRFLLIAPSTLVPVSVLETSKYFRRCIKSAVIYGNKIEVKFVNNHTQSLAFRCKTLLNGGSGCGSVGRAIASGPRGPRFESSHRHKVYIEYFCLFKIRKKKKEAGNGPFKKIAERTHFSTILPLIFISNYSDCEC